MTDRTILRRKRVKDAASRIFGTTPIAWLLYLAIPGALIANAISPTAENVRVDKWVVPITLSASLLVMWTHLYTAGAIGRWTKVFWSAASVGVGAGVVLTAYQPGAPYAYAVPLLAIPVAVVLLVPLVGPATTNAPDVARRGVWTRGTRVLVRLVPAFVPCALLSLLAGFIADLTVDAWPVLAAIDVFASTFLCTFLAATLGIFALSSSNPLSFSAPLSGVELQLAKIGFTFASLASIAGCIGLYVARAFASGQVLPPSQVELQASLLTGLAVIGPLALFLGSPFVDGDTGLRGGVSRGLGRLMRLFPPAFVVLLAWSGPAVFSSWALGTWTAPERMGVCLIGATTVYCALRTVFDVLGHRLPIRLLLIVFAGATLTCGLTYA